MKFYPIFTKNFKKKKEKKREKFYIPLKIKLNKTDEKKKKKKKNRMSVALVVPKMLPLEIKNNNPKKKCIASNKKKFESIIFTFFGIDDAENRQ